MGKKSENQVLTTVELEALPPLKQDAISEFEAARSGYNESISRMLKGCRIAVETKVGEKWKRLSAKSKEDVLSQIFATAREIMKVDLYDGTGMPTSTFNTYCTYIKRIMIFHCSLDDAKRHANYALRDILNKAINDNRGGTLEEKVSIIAEECRKDPAWVGNPKPLTTRPTVEALNSIQLPIPGVEDNPRQLIRMGIGSFLEWAKQSRVREILKGSEDPAIKQVYVIYKDMLDVFDDLKDNMKVAV